MRKFFKYNLIFTVLLGLFLSNAQDSEANFTRYSSKIKIVNPINIKENSKINLGTIEKPSSGSSTIEVDYTGQINSENLNIIDSSTASQASYTIFGTDNANVGIDVEYIANEQFISVNSINGIYDGTKGDLSNGINNISTSTNGKTLDFGISLMIDSEISEGNYQPRMTLNVNYE